MSKPLPTAIEEDANRFFAALLKARNDVIFGEPVFLHTTDKVYDWEPYQVDVFREHIWKNIQTPYDDLDTVLKRLGYRGYENVLTQENLNFKTDILLPKVREKIKELVNKEFQPAAASGNDEPQVQEHRAPRPVSTRAERILRESQPQPGGPEWRRGPLVPESVEQIYGALSKLNDASTSLRFMYGDLPEIHPITRQLESLKIAGRDLRTLIENRVDGMTKTWAGDQKGKGKEEDILTREWKF